MAETKVVFGTGICLQNNWKLIEKHFTPEYLTDNNKEIWNTYPWNKELKCICPESLRQLPEPNVLISVGDPYAIEKIEGQLDKMRITHTDIYTFIEQWGAAEEFPKHLLRLKESRGRRRFIIFNSPEHDNMGDHLISMAELEFFHQFCPDEEVIEVTDIEYLWYHDTIKKYVTAHDRIIITGGGFLGSLWLYNGEANVRKVIEEYPDNRIIIMPQTIFFEENTRGRLEEKKTREIYNSHKKLTVCLREKESYDRMRLLAEEHVKVELAPDMALFLNYTREHTGHTERKGILSCLRKDKESIICASDKEKIRLALQNLGKDYKEITMHSGICTGIEDRKEMCEKKIEEIRNSELVVTDTLHCMIICAITGTPCIAINNISKKVENVYQWISYLRYILFLSDVSFIDEAIQKLAKMGGQVYDNSPLQEYYGRLAKVVNIDE